MKYKVLVDDNVNDRNDDARTGAGQYDTAEEAIAHAEGIVETCLLRLYTEGMTAKNLYDSYVALGRDPFIIGPQQVSFSAWNYARTTAADICAKAKVPARSGVTG